MPFDPFAFIHSVEQKHPRFGRWLTMAFLGQLSPFNFHLRADLQEWTESLCRISVKRRRRVRNHVGSIHAGALFTLGETCAGLVIIRNFPFKSYRPLMSDVRVTYTKQARGAVTGEAAIPPATIAAMKDQIARGEIPFTEVVTHIYNDAKEEIATVTTTWQVKAWQLVTIK